MNKKLILSIIMLALAVVPTKALADEYGEVEVEREISVEKKVYLPAEARDSDDGEWVDNIYSSKYTFKPLQEVIFKVTVKNTGNRALEDVYYKDVLPSYLRYVSGDLEETFDLDVDEEKVFDQIKAQVVDSSDLPDDQGTYCVLNTAEAWKDDAHDKDSAQICIHKEGEVLGVTTLPAAGPSDSLYLLLGSGVFGLAGWALLKKK